ncbi:putative methyltransferase-domain-containing protein [Xylariaceae sp. FL0594]|nr:putative methyltransferase-domain-containing protein [Xylariaceae sp. FL0594]
MDTLPAGVSEKTDTKMPLITTVESTRSTPSASEPNTNAEEGNENEEALDLDVDFMSPLALAAPDLTPLPQYKQAGTTEIDFDGLLLPPAAGGRGPLKLHEDLANGCGGQLWPAGMTLAKYVLRYRAGDLASKRILELGAGGGLVGLAVAKGCQLDEDKMPLYITDQLEMYELMKHNIKLNDLEGQVEALILNWGEPLPDVVVRNPPDVVLAADCVYFEPAFPLLQTTLGDLFAANGDAVVYFCFKKRRRADMQFLKQARRKFSVSEVLDDADKPVWSRQGLFMFEFRAKGKGKGPN